jgi:hypothetical protein
VFAEERKFAVAPGTSPTAFGWLMRTQIPDGAWGDWMGVDHEIVAASGFEPWKEGLSFNESRSKSLSSCLAAPKSQRSIDTLAREARRDQTSVAEQNSVNMANNEKPLIADFVETNTLYECLPSTGDGPSLHMANSCPCAGVHRPILSLKAGHWPDEEIALSLQSSSDEEISSQQETSSDDDFSSDVAIIVSTKRRILESIMNEFSTNFFGNAAGKFRCQSEKSETSSSSNADKLSSSSKEKSEDLSSISAGKKRSADREAFSENEDGCSQKRPKKTTTASSTTARARLLACPFNKHDSSIYSSSNEGQDLAYKFRSCGGPGWPKVARLK